MSATHTIQSTPNPAPVLYMASFELGHLEIGPPVGAGQPPRIRSVPARCISLVMDEIKKAKVRFDLPATTPVVSCYEAGRDGFWIHRVLAEGAFRTSSSTPRRLRSAGVGVEPSPIVSMR